MFVIDQDLAFQLFKHKYIYIITKQSTKTYCQIIFSIYISTFFEKKKNITSLTLTSKFKRLPPSTPRFRIFDIDELPVFVCKDYLPSPLKNGATCRRITLNIGVRKFCRFGKTHVRFADFFFHV